MIIYKLKGEKIYDFTIKITCAIWMTLLPLSSQSQDIQMHIHQDDGIISYQTENIDSVTFSINPTDYNLQYQNLQLTSPFPMGLDSLKVLILGNSFSYDATYCLQAMLDSTSIQQEKIGIFNYSIPSASFQTWIDTYLENKSITPTNIIGKKEMHSSGTLKEILNQQWDIILLLTSSSISYDWTTFKSTLPTILEIVKNNCPNDKLKIAYMLPWGHTKRTTPKELVGNIQCAKQAMKITGLDFIIPVGIAVENARHSKLQNDKNLTRDDWHLCFGIGRYIAACTMFESLITPIFHLSCYNNNGVRPLTQNEMEFNGTIPITKENIHLCQECAILSTYYRFNVAKSNKDY